MVLFNEFGHQRSEHFPNDESLSNLQDWISETKETNSIDSIINAVYAQLCLASFLVGAGNKVLTLYLSRLIFEATMNYAQQDTIDMVMRMIQIYLCS